MGLNHYTSSLRWSQSIMQPYTMAIPFGVSGQCTLMGLLFTNDISIPCRPKITTWSLVHDQYEILCIYHSLSDQGALNWHSCIVPQEKQNWKHCLLTTVKCKNVLVNLQRHMKPSLLRMSEECAWHIWPVQRASCSSLILHLMRKVYVTWTSLMTCSFC